MGPTSVSRTAGGRRQNRRGEGARLQQEILTAAGVLLERTGSEELLTLRSVARETGITAPAIYAHFADREEIVQTLVVRTFAELAEALRRTARTVAHPRDRLVAICRTYLDFASERPHHYRVLFGRHRSSTATDEAPADLDAVSVQTMVGADAFGVLLDTVAACIEDGSSTARSPEDAATRIWVGLHGQTTLHQSLPWFPWPDRDDLLTDMLVRLGDL